MRKRSYRIPDFWEALDSGFITCTRGQPGAIGSTYAPAGRPLDNPEHYPPKVRERHALNMLRTLPAKGNA